MSGPLAFFAAIGFLLFSIPWLAVAGAALVAGLHFWIGASWWWMLAPGVVFAAWTAFRLWAWD
jgi:hypothetical protein